MSQATPAVESEELLERMGYEPELNRELKSSDLVVFLMPRRTLLDAYRLALGYGRL